MCSTQWKSTMAMNNCSAGLCQLVFKRSERLVGRAFGAVSECMRTASATSFSLIYVGSSAGGAWGVPDIERGL
jgi:hypothetical protein